MPLLVPSQKCNLCNYNLLNAGAKSHTPEWTYIGLNDFQLARSISKDKCRINAYKGTAFSWLHCGAFPASSISLQCAIAQRMYLWHGHRFCSSIKSWFSPIQYLRWQASSALWLAVHHCRELLQLASFKSGPPTEGQALKFYRLFPRVCVSTHVLWVLLGRISLYHGPEHHCICSPHGGWEVCLPSSYQTPLRHHIP